jgi:hypothetical protein
MRSFAFGILPHGSVVILGARTVLILLRIGPFSLLYRKTRTAVNKQDRRMTIGAVMAFQVQLMMDMMVFLRLCFFLEMRIVTDMK